MGVSTDGILFYGVELGEPGQESTAEAGDWVEEPWDWEDHYAKRKGVVRGKDENYGDFYDRKKVVLEESGCSIGTHCAGEYPMLYVSVKEFSAYRGSPIALSEKDFFPPIDAEEKLRAFCEVMGIVFDPATVGWHLTSYWG